MYRQIQQQLNILVKQSDFWATFVASVIYSSWPLGFILNPAVAHRDFASQLEAAHEPYNWLFMALDIASGLLLCVVGIRQWRRTRQHTSLRISVAAYVLFAILVILAASAPDDCPTGAYCKSLQYNPAYLLHGFSSVVSVVFLLISLLLSTYLLITRRLYRWFVLLALFILAGWGLTGIGALIELSHHLRSNWLQYDLITVCSISILLCMVLIESMSGHIEVARTELGKSPKLVLLPFVRKR